MKEFKKSFPLKIIYEIQWLSIVQWNTIQPYVSGSSDLQSLLPTSLIFLWIYALLWQSFTITCRGYMVSLYVQNTYISKITYGSDKIFEFQVLLELLSNAEFLNSFTLCFLLITYINIKLRAGCFLGHFY